MRVDHAERADGNSHKREYARQPGQREYAREVYTLYLHRRAAGHEGDGKQEADQQTGMAAATRAKKRAHLAPHASQ